MHRYYSNFMFSPAFAIVFCFNLNLNYSNLNWNLNFSNLNVSIFACSLKHLNFSYKHK